MKNGQLIYCLCFGILNLIYSQIAKSREIDDNVSKKMFQSIIPEIQMNRLIKLHQSADLYNANLQSVQFFVVQTKNPSAQNKLQLLVQGIHAMPPARIQRNALTIKSGKHHLIIKATTDYQAYQFYLDNLAIDFHKYSSIPDFIENVFPPQTSTWNFVTPCLLPLALADNGSSALNIDQRTLILAVLWYGHFYVQDKKETQNNLTVVEKGLNSLQTQVLEYCDRDNYQKIKDQLASNLTEDFKNKFRKSYFGIIHTGDVLIDSCEKFVKKYYAPEKTQLHEQLVEGLALARADPERRAEINQERQRKQEQIPTQEQLINQCNDLINQTVDCYAKLQSGDKVVNTTQTSKSATAETITATPKIIKRDSVGAISSGQ